MKIVQVFVWVSTTIRFLETKKHIFGVCFVLAKKPTKGMAKKVGVQEEEREEG